MEDGRERENENGTEREKIAFSQHFKRVGLAFRRSLL